MAGYFEEPPAWTPATAAALGQFAICWTNDLRPHAAPPVSAFVRFSICPLPKEFGNPGEANYQDGDRCSLGHHYMLLGWEQLPLFEYRRLLHCYANAKLQPNPNYSPLNPAGNPPTAGTFARTWICYQDLWGAWNLSTGVMSEPTAVLSGELATNVELGIGRLGLHLDDEDYDYLDFTLKYWDRFGLTYGFEPTGIGGPYPWEYGNSKFGKPETQKLRRYLFGTGEINPA